MQFTDYYVSLSLLLSRRGRYDRSLTEIAGDKSGYYLSIRRVDLVLCVPNVTTSLRLVQVGTSTGKGTAENILKP